MSYQGALVVLHLASFEKDHCRDYNRLVASVSEEVAEIRRVQNSCIQEQMRLDEESLQRLEAFEEVKKVNQEARSAIAYCSAGCLHLPIVWLPEFDYAYARAK